jgi:hypothetical protein
VIAPVGSHTRALLEVDLAVTCGEKMRGRACPANHPAEHSGTPIAGAAASPCPSASAPGTAEQVEEIASRVMRESARPRPSASPKQGHQPADVPGMAHPLTTTPRSMTWASRCGATCRLLALGCALAVLLVFGAPAMVRRPEWPAGRWSGSRSPGRSACFGFVEAASSRAPGLAQRADPGRHPGTAHRPDRGPSTRSSSPHHRRSVVSVDFRRVLRVIS